MSSGACRPPSVRRGTRRSVLRLTGWRRRWRAVSGTSSVGRNRLKPRIVKRWVPQLWRTCWCCGAVGQPEHLTAIACKPALTSVVTDLRCYYRFMKKSLGIKGPQQMAESEGFEPSMELLTPYSLSRGAPSASRATLRRRDGARDERIPAQSSCGKPEFGPRPVSPRWMR